MYRVPKIKRFSTITEQSQQSWRSNLSSESKRHIFLQDISQNLLLLKEDLVNFFENNKDYLFPTENEEYISLNTSSIIVSPEELLYRLIDIIKSNDFIYRLEEASTTITSLSKQLDEVKSDFEGNIYDEYNNLIFEGYTYNIILEINLYFNKIYKIEAIFLNERIQKTIYINNNIYVIPFSTGFNISKSSFLLTDYYYDNLPIERGEIILWPK